VQSAWVEEIRASLPELPPVKRERYVTKLGLGRDVADVLVEHPKLSAWFERAFELAGGDAKRVANFLVNEVKRDVTYHGLDAQFPLAPEHIAELIKLVDAGTISGKIAKDVYGEMVRTRKRAADIVEDKGSPC